ncbi:hypothetical protein [Terrisporobacter mayombei]|uniref:Transposase n=1 Tax=Terrisporobacter mayombei TaxID=1541 RepID=A0ABY9Q020_9FIRM|nr:hypothetical protein [Terrisporobacter mayombei]MCC3866704.1 hypothetical protein [Terrisporobacter mayombei]WMT80941.1 hypothetical protein TEMA_12650 [Terrisporobacter mayombei]
MSMKAITYVNSYSYLNKYHKNATAHEMRDKCLVKLVIRNLKTDTYI